MAELRLATRKSPLARWQAQWVAQLLAQAGVSTQLVFVTTRGDRQQSTSIARLGAQGVFTREIQQAVLDGRADAAVHSLKDLPTDPVPGLLLAAVPRRGPVQDVLIARNGLTLEQLPAGAAIGTGSLRRRAQLLRRRGDLKFVAMRGNVDTRLEKLRRGECDALMLAEAGLQRLGLQQHVTQRLPLEWVLPAVGQGAVGVECRRDDAAAREALARIDDAATHQAVLAERALLRSLRGGCLAPVAALAQVVHQRLRLQAVVLSPDGTHRLHTTVTGEPEQAESLGEEAARELLDRGAAELIEQARRDPPA